MIRLSGELRYAVAVRKNTAQSITPSEKAKQKTGPHQVFFRTPYIRNILHSPNLSYSQSGESNASIASRIPLCPHTGQSSQLLSDANDRSAQFLATLSGNGLILPLIPRSRALVRKRLRVWRDNARAHTGQSSQLFADANDRMPSFFPTHALGIPYVPETLKIFANLEDPSVEAGAFVTHNQSKK